jgi:plastocyanin
VKRRWLGVALGFALAAVAAAPAQAAKTVDVAGLDSLTWNPPFVDIEPGDTVRWTFTGTAQFHNVEANSPNWTTPDAPAAALPGNEYTFTFRDEGSFDFVCSVHPDTMTGTVRVAAIPPPPPPPPPLSEQPFGNDATAPVTPETVTLDRARPKLTSLRARSVSAGARVRYKVSEESVVTVRLKRRGRTVKSGRYAGTGLQGVTFRVRAGRYRVEVRAVDLAGNRTAWRKLSLTVR